MLGRQLAQLTTHLSSVDHGDARSKFWRPMSNFGFSTMTSRDDWLWRILADHLSLRVRPEQTFTQPQVSFHPNIKGHQNLTLRLSNPAFSHVPWFMGIPRCFLLMVMTMKKNLGATIIIMIMALGSVHYFVRILQFEQRSDLFWPTHPPSNSNIEDK